MARRPDNVRGELTFQEGKRIEDEYYIIAVYDDPASCTISFAAYELENDCTYTYPLTYSEFDALYTYDSELMNPSNQDGRYHWVIERLDFVQDAHGNKVLCLAQEPTPGDDEDGDNMVEQERPKQTVAPPMGGKVDAATRVKLIKELDTQDDHKLFVQLVKSEDARKLFVSKLQAMRLLQVEKASQRLVKADEKREERLMKLDIIKKQQEEKARLAKEKEKAEQSTMAQLELLMKQKEATAIRKLIQEKDAADQGAGREKDAARAKRKMQERSAAEVRAIEAERAQQLARKRADQVTKKEKVLEKRNRQISERVFEVKDAERAKAITAQEEKDQIIADLWERKAAKRAEEERVKNEFEAMEEVREKMNVNRDRKRAITERDMFREIREAEAADVETRRARLASTHKEFHLQWKVDLSNAAMAQREQDRRTLGRERRIQQKADLRLRKFREQQFLATRKPTEFKEGADPEADRAKADENLVALGSSPEEMAEFQKSYEQMERQRRANERNEKRALEDAKVAKMSQLTGPDPGAKEMARIKAWKKRDKDLEDKLMNARLKRELDQEKAVKDGMDKAQLREETTARLDAKRLEASMEREKMRMAACVERHKNLPLNTNLPRVLIY